eukprot:3556890-Rhodomonas_salina.1
MRLFAASRDCCPRASRALLATMIGGVLYHMRDFSTGHASVSVENSVPAYATSVRSIPYCGVGVVLPQTTGGVLAWTLSQY